MIWRMSMHELFPAFYDLSDDEISKLWQEGIVGCHSESCVKRNFPNREQRGDNTGISCPFHQHLQFHQGGNYACLQETAYHIAPNGFNARVLVASHAGSTSLPSVPACAGAECRADGDRNRDDRGARCTHWRGMGGMQPQAQRLSQWPLS